MSHAPARPARESAVPTRTEHLQWAKDRALEYAGNGDVVNAIASLQSDLGKHPETAGHDGIMLMAMLAMNGHLDTPARVRDCIEGFS